MKNEHLVLETARYPALLAVIKVLRFAAWAVFVLSGLFALISPFTGSAIIIPFILIGGFILGVILIAASESLKLFIDIEASIRSISKSLYQQTMDNEI